METINVWSAACFQEHYLHFLAFLAQFGHSLNHRHNKLLLYLTTLLESHGVSAAGLNRLNDFKYCVPSRTYERFLARELHCYETKMAKVIEGKCSMSCQHDHCMITANLLCISCWHKLILPFN